MFCAGLVSILPISSTAGGRLFMMPLDAVTLPVAWLRKRYVLPPTFSTAALLIETTQVAQGEQAVLRFRTQVPRIHEKGISRVPQESYFIQKTARGPHAGPLPAVRRL